MNNGIYKIVSILIFLLIIQLNQLHIEGINTLKTNIIYVGGEGEGNFSKIQEGIDKAEQGNLVYVYAGIYHEKINLYKNIILMGENKYTTIIDGKGNSDTIFIESNNCSIKRFTIKNCSKIASANINIFSNNNIISDNILINNSNIGIFLYHSRNNSIINNSFINCSIYISGNLTSWNTHNIKNNSINNKELIYYKNKKNNTLSNKTLGQIILANCSNFIIKNIQITKMDQAIILGHSTRNIVINNTLKENNIGILLDYSSNNTIERNMIEKNTNGLQISHSENNIIKKNDIIYNKNFGCWICCGSNNNTIYLNNFILNDKNAYDAFKNHWSKDKIGNYWSDYTGVDNNNDGIGDAFYNGIKPNAKNKDLYPIMSQIIHDEENDNNNVNGFEIISLIFVILFFIIFIKLKKKN
jgi:nitrous oxidase accessory protein